MKEVEDSVLINREIPKMNQERPTSTLSGISPDVKRGSVSVTAELRHVSMLVYAVSPAAARRLVPAGFELAESIIDGRRTAWLSVVSFIDNGSKVDGKGIFEQTEYRLHVIRDGKPAQWLIGTSLGSLSAVGMRNLWPMPWHLGAMEFQVTYDPSRGRYSHYHLHTQSQWENASWDIVDTGEAVMNPDGGMFPASLFADMVTTYFERRDGSTGSYVTRNSGAAFTKSELRSGQSEMLQRSGLVSRDSIGFPALAVVQRTMKCQHYSPSIINPGLNEEVRMMRYAYAS